MRSRWKRATGGGRLAAWLACVGLINGVVGGCSRDDGRVPVYPVKGKVTLAKEIPEGALVVFYPIQEGGEGELRPSAKVRSDGSFSLTTYDAEDGAPAGEYTGTLQWNKLVKKGRDYVAGPDAIRKDYTGRQTSPWKIKVTDGPNELAPLAILK